MAECGDAKAVKIFAMIGVCDRRKSIVWWGFDPCDGFGFERLELDEKEKKKKGAN